MRVSLNEALAPLVDVERTIAVGELKVAAAWPAFPSGPDLDLPCFMNTWQLESYTRRPNEQRERVYVVRPQLLLHKSMIDGPYWASVANDFHDAFMDAFDAATKLGHLQMFQRLRGEPGQYWPGTLTWNDLPYYGLQWLVELRILDSTEIGIGDTP